MNIINAVAKRAGELTALVVAFYYDQNIRRGVLLAREHRAVDSQWIIWDVFPRPDEDAVLFANGEYILGDTATAELEAREKYKAEIDDLQCSTMASLRRHAEREKRVQASDVAVSS